MGGPHSGTPPPVGHAASPPPPAAPAQTTLDQLLGHGTTLLGSLVAIGLGCADAFTRARWGQAIDLGLIALGLSGLGLQAGGVLPR